MNKEKRVVTVAKASEMTGLPINYIYNAMRNDYIKEYRMRDALPVDRDPYEVGRKIMKYVDVCELWSYKQTIEKIKLKSSLSRRWTAQDDEILIAMHRAGRTISDISEELVRTPGAIITRITRLKWKK